MAAFSSRARLLLLRTCYHSIIGIVCAGGSQFGKEPSRHGSYWIPRQALRTDGYDSQHHGHAFSPNPGWLGDFISWGSRSGNRWAWFLAPFLLVIRLLEADEHKTIPSSIYTLF
jgi:hypothetical protein